MPNHCCNCLMVTDTAMPIIVKNYIGEDTNGEMIFDFEKIIPIGNVSDSYAQRVERWGTKWVGYDLNIGETCIDFFTAWSPPVPIIRKLAELHKDIAFRLEYYEMGMAFRGVTTAEWKDGTVLFTDQCWNMTEKDYIELGYGSLMENEHTSHEGG